MPKTPEKRPGRTPGNRPDRTPEKRPDRTPGRSPGKSPGRKQHNIVFPGYTIKSKYIRDYDDDYHRHYRDYRQFVLPTYEPVYRYSYQCWMYRFYAIIQDISLNYPAYPTTYDRENMERFLLSLPSIIPCRSSLCKAYVSNHIERNRENFDALTANRNYLQEFLRDFYMDLKQKFGHELYEDSCYHGIV